jgi:hypothetical protein
MVPKLCVFSLIVQIILQCCVLRKETLLINSVADPDPGSGAFLTPRFGKGFFRIPDPKPIFFESLMTIFELKSSMILFKLA